MNSRGRNVRELTTLVLSQLDRREQVIIGGRDASAAPPTYQKSALGTRKRHLSWGQRLTTEQSDLAASHRAPAVGVVAR